MNPKKKDVLFLCQYSYPDQNSSATLPFDTALYLAKRGLSVGVLCGCSGEYSHNKNTPLHETVNGVAIHRVRYLQLDRKSKVGRLLNFFSLMCGMLFHTFVLRQYKCVIVYSNPPTLPLIACIGSALFRTKIVFVSYDVYPEVAYASKSLRPGSITAAIMRCINKKLFRKASAVVALTDEMRAYLLRHRNHIGESRTHVIANWAHEDIPELSNKARERFAFEEDDFVVCYLGNMGICQDTSALIQAIDLLQNEPHIKFLIAGHGSKLPEVRKAVGGLPSVKIFDFLTGAELSDAIRASSCGIVSLERGLIGMCAPSKYYSYLQGGLPVIAIAEEQSYLVKEVQTRSIGYAVPVGNGQRLAAVLRVLAADSTETAEMSCRASALYKQQYAREIGLEKYYMLIKEIIESSNE